MNNTVVPDTVICDQTSKIIDVASRMPILSSNKFNVSQTLHTKIGTYVSTVEVSDITRTIS